MNQDGAIRDAKKLGVPKMLILGLQHMFAMFGATILVPILVNNYFYEATGENLSRGLTVSVTLFCAGFGTLLFHVCAKMICLRRCSSCRSSVPGAGPDYQTDRCKARDAFPSAGSDRTGNHLHRPQSGGNRYQQCFYELADCDHCISDHHYF